MYKPRKNLRHFKPPAGTYHAQYDVILNKAKGVVDGIVSSGATHSKAQLFYDSVYCPTVEYTLPQYFLSQKQLSDTKKKTLPRLYTCCGFNQNTSRAILQCPAGLGVGGHAPQDSLWFGLHCPLLKKILSPHEDAGKLV